MRVLISTRNQYAAYIFQIFIGGAILLFSVALERWQWGFWHEMDNVRFNSLIGVFCSYVTSVILLERFLSYPVRHSFPFILPTVTCIFSLLVLVMFFIRLEYSRLIVLESYILTLIFCGIFYWLRIKRYKQTYLLLPFGRIHEMSTGDIGYNMVYLKKPVIPVPAVDGVVVDFEDKNISSEWEVFFAQCALKYIPVIHFNNFREMLTGRVKIENLREHVSNKFSTFSGYFFIKRVVDVLLAASIILILLPFLIVIAFIIKIDSPGKVIFSQIRVGLGDADFKIYKFRSMHTDAEKKGEKLSPVADDRVTRVGRFMRKVRVDELPQLFNVIIGDMSLIGPRPEQRSFVELFKNDIAFYQYRHTVRPGISGWAQVNSGYADDIAQTRVKLEYDLFYIKYFSFWLDLLILFKTIKTVLTGFGGR